MRRTSKVLGLLTAAALTAGLAAAPASAAVIVATLPHFDGPFNGSGFPIDFGPVGAFTYAIPGTATITSATFSGTYGTPSYAFSTASFDAVIDGELINVCPLSGACWFNNTAFRPFSFALSASTFASLLDGSAVMQLIQTSGNYIRLGSPTLTIEYTAAAVPAPGAALLLLTGLAALARRRRENHTVN